LSGLRYGGHTRVAPVIGRYDAYLSAEVAGGGKDSWSDPDLVLRIGASPTSKRLRKYLAATGADQYQVDPAGRWREAEFAATDLVVAEPSRLCARLSRLVGGGGGSPDWRAQWEEADRVAESIHSREADALDEATALGDEAATDDVDAGFHEGDALRAVAEALPDPATLFVSNSMPVRDLDRFVGPTTANVTALGNRGVSGIDGIVSGALGARAGTTDDVTLVLGDLALYHDSNGLLAVERCDADATVVTLNNDGGGIFHKLPIESFEPPFTESFKTPHGLDFEPLAALHGLEYERIDARPDALADRGESPTERADAVADEVAAAVSRAHEEPGSHLIEVDTDAEASHRTRERLAAAVDAAVHGDASDE
ncbi:2-succinyl-6-hydroxy-2,4-cyclohexadiene-1-carboxylate synthase, partial [Halorubrum coriense DSM 10284]